MPSADDMHGLPPLYATWMAQLLDGPIPEETEATCEQCAMCTDARTDAASPGRQLSFRPDTKCCTYLPELHNFLIGAILLDEDPASAAGRASVADRIARKVAVTPLGLGRSRSHVLVYDDGGARVFGRARAILCPHFVAESGRCGIWRHRESTCATWFCKHVRGRVGRDFWHALQRLLATVERSLSWWCLGQVGIDAAALEALLVERESGQRTRQRVDVSDLDGGPPPRYRALWGSWVDREAELYVACARQVEGLSWAEVLARCGAEAGAAARSLRHHHGELRSEAVPPRLTSGSFRILELRGESCRIEGYSEYDPVELPTAALELLPSFDGRPVEAVLAELEEERGVTIEPALVRRLVDFGILDEPGA